MKVRLGRKGDTLEAPVGNELQECLAHEREILLRISTNIKKHKKLSDSESKEERGGVIWLYGPSPKLTDFRSNLGSKRFAILFIVRANFTR